MSADEVMRFDVAEHESIEVAVTDESGQVNQKYVNGRTGTFTLAFVPQEDDGQ